MGTEILIETLDLTEAQLDVDNRTIRQRLIKAGTSQNRRQYPDAVLQAAAPLFEGTRTYVNHPSTRDMKERPERDVRHITGWLEGVRYENGALYGTRHFTENEAGEDVWKLVRSVVEGKAPPSLVGASINAIGKARREKQDKGDLLIVESIDQVNSVDDVTSPAAGGGFDVFAASAGDDLKSAFIESLSYEEWFEARPEFRKRLQKEMKKARQTDALKAAQAEAERLTADYQEVQEQLEAMRQRAEAAEADAAKVRHTLMVEESVQKFSLPVAWKNSLREQLQDADPETWDGILQREVRKANVATSKNRVPVEGAGQQVDTMNETQQPPPSLDPREGEDVEAWMRRIQELQ